MSSPYYETFNIYLAAFLRCKGAVLVGFERVGKRKVFFRFVADEKLHLLVRLYWSEAPVGLVPLGLFGSLRRLKQLVRRRPAVPGGSTPPAALPSPPPSCQQTCC